MTRLFADRMGFLCLRRDIGESDHCQAGIRPAFQLSCMRLNFSNSDNERIFEGITRLGKVIKEEAS